MNRAQERRVFLQTFFSRTEKKKLFNNNNIKACGYNSESTYLMCAPLFIKIVLSISCSDQIQTLFAKFYAFGLMWIQNIMSRLLNVVVDIRSLELYLNGSHLSINAQLRKIRVCNKKVQHISGARDTKI